MNALPTFVIVVSFRIDMASFEPSSALTRFPFNEYSLLSDMQVDRMVCDRYVI